MSDEFGNGVFSIPSPRPEEDAASSYMILNKQREDANIESWLSGPSAAPAVGSASPIQNGSGAAAGGAAGDPALEQALSAIGGGAALGAAPAGIPEAAIIASPTGDPVSAGGLSSLIDPNAAPADGVIKRVAKDIGGGIVEAPKQIVGGVISALGEIDQFMQSVIPIGGMTLWDKNGNFDPSLASHEQMVQLEKAGQDLATMIAPKNPDTVTGGFVRSTAQFLTAFIPAAAAVGATGGAVLGPMASSLTSGAIASLVAFDPHQARLSTFLNEVPALAGIVPDYLADNNPANESDWQGRIKNVAEGIGLGLATEGLVRSFKYYKAQAAAKVATNAADPVTAQVQAGKDAMKDAASTELVIDVKDAELMPLGDPNAPLVITGSQSETAGQAFQRLADTSLKAEKAAADGSALARVNQIRQDFAKRGGKDAVAAGRDPVDDMIDAIRSGVKDPSPKRPAYDAIRARGGVDPKSVIGGELRAAGITPKSMPGLFSASAKETVTAQGKIIVQPLRALDNVPVGDVEIFRDRGLGTSDGYIPESEWINALQSELKGQPYRSTENQKSFEDLIKPVDELSAELDRLGIDVSASSNESVKAQIKAVEDRLALEAHQASIPHADQVGLPAGFDPQSEGVPNIRTQADLNAESAAMKAAGADVPTSGVVAVQPQGKIFINHARISSADDVKKVLQEFADMDAASIDAKRRGVVSNEQTIKESAQEYHDLRDLIGRDPGPMNAAQAVASRRLLASSGEQIIVLAKKAQAVDATKADIFNFRRAMAVHYAIQSEVIAARTETARALQAWAIPAGATKARGQAINDLIMNAGGAGDIQQFAKMVATVGDNPTALNTMARELGRGRFGKALYQVWINGLLSGPKTHLTNILSNSMVSVWAIPERYMASGISKVFYNGEIQGGEAAAQAFGMVKGIRDGIRLVALGNKAEKAGGLSDVFDAFGKADNVHGNAISAEAFGLKSEGSLGWGIDMLGKFVNLPGAALNSEDKFFKAIGYRMELNSLAYRQAAKEGLEGKDFASRVVDIINNPPDHLKAEAIDVAHYQTFTNPLGEIGRVGKQFISKVPGARWVVPFVGTPTNILKYTFARTPLAYLSGSIRSDIRAGGARAAQAHARVALGSMTMLTMMDMASEGTITGRGPLDPKVRQAKQLSGWMPYSVKIGDRWFSYSRTDPIGMVMGLGSDMAEIMSNAQGEDAETLAAAGVIALANNLANKTYMSGIFDFMAAIDPNNPSSDPGKWIMKQAGGLVPYAAFLRTLKETGDPVQRNTKEDVFGADGQADQIASFLQTAVNNVKKGIPGLSDELPPMRDLFGDPIENVSGIGWGWDILSPIASRLDDPDPVIRAIVDNKVAISAAPKSINDVRLSAGEYSDFQEVSGKLLKSQLDLLVKSDGFKRLSDGPDGMKAELIRKTVFNAREVARAQMIVKHPELRERFQIIQLDKMKNLQGN